MVRRFQIHRKRAPRIGRVIVGPLAHRHRDDIGGQGPHGVHVPVGREEEVVEYFAKLDIRLPLDDKRGEARLAAAIGNCVGRSGAHTCP